MSSRSQQCHNCRFWDGPARDVRAEQLARGEPCDVGEVWQRCRRWPPSTPDYDVAADGTAVRLSRFLSTECREWCGEWQARSPQTVDEAAAAMARAVLAGDAAAGHALADRLMELVVITPPEPST